MNETSVSRNVTDRLSPAELRLGNYFKYKGEGTLGRYIQKVQTEHIEFLENPEMRHEMIEPIPLDKTWIQNFGFYWDEKKVYQCINTTAYRIRIASRGVTLFQHGNSVTIPNVKYVHQLQNLYFALCGEELEINGLQRTSV